MEHARNIFRRKGLRCTKQRLVVYSALAGTKSHPSAEDLFGTLKGSGESLSLATVYNTLDALVEEGLARKMPSGSGPVRYDADVTDHVHVATPDGRIFDIPEDLSEQILDRLPDELVQEIQRRTGLKIDRVSVQLLAEERN